MLPLERKLKMKEGPCLTDVEELLVEYEKLLMLTINTMNLLDEVLAGKAHPSQKTIEDNAFVLAKLRSCIDKATARVALSDVEERGNNKMPPGFIDRLAGG